MARDFLSTSSEYLIASAVPTGVVPVTIACWVYTDAIQQQGLVGINRSTDASAFEGWVLFLPNVAGSLYVAVAEQRTDAFYGQALASVILSPNTWHHACGVFRTAASRTAYIDGGNSNTDTTNMWGDQSGLDKTIIGAFYYNGALGNYMQGRLAEVGIWNIALTAAEVYLLSRGVPPYLIRPRNLALYVPLLSSEDVDIVNGLRFSAGGTPLTSPHPYQMGIRREIFNNRTSFDPATNWLKNQGMPIIPYIASTPAGGGARSQGYIF